MKYLFLYGAVFFIPLYAHLTLLVLRRKDRLLSSIYGIFFLVSLPAAMIALGSIIADFIAHCRGGDVAFSCEVGLLSPVVSILTFGYGWGSFGLMFFSLAGALVTGILFLVTWLSARRRK
jgi:hypothetical protein